MAKNVVEHVQTTPIGFAPILAHYFKKCRIVDIIDSCVPVDPRRKVLTHGQAAMAMITGILFQVMQLYRICQFAKPKISEIRMLMTFRAAEDHAV